MLHVSGPGSYVVRVRYSPYRSALPASACLSQTSNGMTLVTSHMPGFVQMDIDTDPASVAANAADEHPDHLLTRVLRGRAPIPCLWAICSQVRSICGGRI